jgi:hypothetical protein
MEASTEPIGPEQRCRSDVCRHLQNCLTWLGRQLAMRTLGSMAVVVVDVLTDHRLEMPPIDDQHSIEAFASDAAGDALDEGVELVNVMAGTACLALGGRGPLLRVSHVSLTDRVQVGGYSPPGPPWTDTLPLAMTSSSASVHENP